jgi:hypothetical protein
MPIATGSPQMPRRRESKQHRQLNQRNASLDTLSFVLKRTDGGAEVAAKLGSVTYQVPFVEHHDFKLAAPSLSRGGALPLLCDISDSDRTCLTSNPRRGV